MSQPSSSSSPFQQPPTTISSIPKKTPPLPWTHLETVSLIEAYQEKWYSLKRGQLKASQWEEVASSVAARCGFKELSKSSTQCRHKMEKLRKRYRGEKQKATPTVWSYFDLMDMMERGPFPLSSRPVALLSAPLPTAAAAYLNRRNPPIDNNLSEEEEDEEEDEEDERNKSTSLNHLLHRGGSGRPPVASPIFDALPLPTKYGGEREGGEGPRESRFLRSPMFRKRKKEFEIDEAEEEGEEEGDDDEDRGGRFLSELALVVRSFGEGFVRVENMKMEMMREQERHRVEMEKKRMEMIQESQRRIVDAIAKTFDAHRKPKKSQQTPAE